MITHLRGKLVEKNPTYVIVECGGIGYFSHISLNTYSKIPDEESVFIYTYLSVKEDSQTLYGFAEKLEREIFKLLISVSGVGPSIARTMLSSMSMQEIQQAIASGDSAKIQSVKGIGAKTSQRVIIDLRDKIIKTYGLDEVSPIQSNTAKEEALTALEVLGFTIRQSEKVIDSILREDVTLNVQDLIKRALKNL
ncbi:MAG: Holliday junction branch migration protein RuvA [Flavobacteriaceae bacterium]|nr:Holliday junction branch migration protein RuvA [Flavobacteriaceae bacterium]